MFSDKANQIFQEVIVKYHEKDSVDQPFENPYDKNTQLLEHLALPQMLDRYGAMAL